MNYQSFEQAWCKITASNDFISQGACWIDFEQQYPPGSQQFLGLTNSLQGLALVIGAVILFAPLLMGGRPKRPVPRRWVDRF